MGNITRHLVDVFPDTPIYPSLGNHDAWPSNQIPVGDKAQEYYGSMYEQAGWKLMLNEAQRQTFYTGINYHHE